MQPLEITQAIETMRRSVETESGLSTSAICRGEALPKSVICCIARYRSATEFLVTFNPDHQCEYCRDLERAYMGAAPNIGVVGRAFGYDTAITWIMAQLRNVSEFSGVSTKLTPRQANEVAEIIYSQWGYLKVTELMHFFLLLKAGCYGKFYGAVDGMVITEAIHEYLRMRNDLRRSFDIAREEAQQQKLKKVHEAEVADFKQCLAVCHMSVKEYLALRQQHNITYQEVADFGWLFRIY